MNSSFQSEEYVVGIVCTSRFVEAFVKFAEEPALILLVIGVNITAVHYIVAAMLHFRRPSGPSDVFILEACVSGLSN